MMIDRLRREGPKEGDRQGPSQLQDRCTTFVQAMRLSRKQVVGFNSAMMYRDQRSRVALGIPSKELL